MRWCQVTRRASESSLCAAQHASSIHSSTYAQHDHHSLCPSAGSGQLQKGNLSHEPGGAPKHGEPACSTRSTPRCASPTQLLCAELCVHANHTAICSLLHASYPRALAKQPAPLTLHLLYACCTCHEHGNTLQACCADYMLVMELEGDNLAHKLHQQVNRICIASDRGLVYPLSRATYNDCMRLLHGCHGNAERGVLCRAGGHHGPRSPE